MVAIAVNVAIFGRNRNPARVAVIRTAIPDSIGLAPDPAGVAG